MRLISLFAFACVMTACSDSKPSDVKATPTSNISPMVYRPTDKDLAETYKQTCYGCHTSNTSGAPLTGDKAAWNQRMEKGMATLLKHTQEGFKGMPGGGSCFDCSEEEFKALITFMANPPAP